MTEFVSKEDLDYDEIFRRGGDNNGDEEFGLFKCPFCDKVYMVECEVDTAYLDGRDLTKRCSVFNSSFDCLGCGRHIPRDRAWVGKKAATDFQVTWEQLARSDWAWSAPRTREMKP
jgi:transcription elongation factor Elf1